MGNAMPTEEIGTTSVPEQSGTTSAPEEIRTASVQEEIGKASVPEPEASEAGSGIIEDSPDYAAHVQGPGTPKSIPSLGSPEYGHNCP